MLIGGDWDDIKRQISEALSTGSVSQVCVNNVNTMFHPQAASGYTGCSVTPVGLYISQHGVRSRSRSRSKET